jgi:hypothetical protein
VVSAYVVPWSLLASRAAARMPLPRWLDKSCSGREMVGPALARPLLLSCPWSPAVAPITAPCIPTPSNPPLANVGSVALRPHQFDPLCHRWRHRGSSSSYHRPRCSVQHVAKASSSSSASFFFDPDARHLATTQLRREHSSRRVSSRLSAWDSDVATSIWAWSCQRPRGGGVSVRRWTRGRGLLLPTTTTASAWKG